MTPDRWDGGVRFRIIEPYVVEATTVFTARHQGHAGWVHGGVIAAVLDEALGRALMSAHPERFMVTARLELRYFKALAIGDPVTIRGEIVSDRRHLATGVCTAMSADGVIAARAEGMLARPLAGPHRKAP